MECQIPLQHIPFSRYGAYLAVSQNEGEEGILLHDARKSFGDDQIYRIFFQCGDERVNPELCARPWCVTARWGEKMAVLYLRDAETLAVDSFGLDLRLIQTNEYGYGIEEPPYYHLINIHHHLYTTVYLQKGEGRLQGPVRKVNDAEPVDVKQYLALNCTEGRLQASFRVGEQENRKFDGMDPQKEIRQVRDEWEAFLGDLPGGEESACHFAVLSWYNLWSSFVRKGGHYHKNTVVMSKKNMCATWSWDHCFNALSLAFADRGEEAWDQFMAPFALQSPNGCLPDMWRPNEAVTWTITKPPIHGWCLGKIMDWTELTCGQLAEAYDGLARWTDWWMEYRDYDKDGIPAYPMGCDCGWDNASAFDIGYFVESPDLPAYLMLQMDTLARVAGILGEEDKAGDKALWQERKRGWEKKKADLEKAFYAHCWEKDRFVTKKSGAHEYVKDASLLNLMPLVLGGQLKKEYRDPLIKRLKEEFLTENGLATESPYSDKYESDGYWRGPIWAPVTYLITDGLYSAGEEELARETAERFCRMLEEKAGGNYENFDARTGKGLRAPGYTWTASVYLLLYWKLWEKKK